MKSRTRAAIGEAAARKAIVSVCNRLWARGLVSGSEGNVSVRLGPDRILVTPSGFAKADLTARDLCIVDGDGAKVRGPHAASSEIAVHLRAYAKRGDVQAVVHAHPPQATAFAVAGEAIPDNVLPEVAVLLGPVPVVAYASPGTPALADRFDALWQKHDVFLMANHGAVTLGPSLSLAHQRMETLENAARIIAGARALGRVNTLSDAEVGRLRSMRHMVKER